MESQHPLTQGEDALRTLSAEAVEKADIISGIGHHAIESSFYVETLAEMQDNLKCTMQEIGYRAILNGVMEQREFAKYSNVSEATVSRNYRQWLKNQTNDD